MADVARRREGLEQIVAGLAPRGMAAAPWGAIAADPRLSRRFDHLVALDPPPGGRGDPLLFAVPRAHLAWGPYEAEFALLVYRAELDLRAALGEAYRALRALPGEAGPDELARALRGGGRYPRTPEFCARLVTVLRELDLIEFCSEPPICRLRSARRTQLERSPTYRAAAERLAAIERALWPELPGQARPDRRAA